VAKGNTLTLIDEKFNSVYTASCRSVTVIKENYIMASCGVTERDYLRTIKSRVHGLCFLGISNVNTPGKRLNVKPEVNNVTVFNDVVFAFQTPFSGVFCPLLAFELNKMIIVDDFGANKAFFEIGMNDTGSLWRS